MLDDCKCGVGPRYIEAERMRYQRRWEKGKGGRFDDLAMKATVLSSKMDKQFLNPFP
jgi:hypothetical protein